MVDLVTKEEMQERMGGNVTPDIIFMTALAMLLEMGGGQFSYNKADLAAFASIHGATGQLGIQVDGDTITVFIYDAPLAQA